MAWDISSLLLSAFGTTWVMPGSVNKFFACQSSRFLRRRLGRWLLYASCDAYGGRGTRDNFERIMSSPLCSEGKCFDFPLRFSIFADFLEICPYRYSRSFYLFLFVYKVVPLLAFLTNTLHYLSKNSTNKQHIKP